MGTLRWSLALLSLLVLIGIGAFLVWLGFRALATASWGMPAWAAWLVLVEGVVLFALWSWCLAWFVGRRLRRLE